jgi:hypothetical protein
VAIGLFNYNPWEVTQTFKFDDVTQVMGIDFTGGATVRSVWEQKDIGIFERSFTMDLEPYTGTLLRLIPVSRSSDK